MKLASLSLLLAGSLLLPGTAQDPLGAPFAGAVEPVAVRTAWSVSAARPGDHVVLAVIADLEEGWHINPDAAQTAPAGGFTPLATELAIEAPADAVTLETPIYPAPHPVRVQFAPAPLMVYEREAVILVGVKVADTAVAGKAIPFEVSLSYQACDDRRCLEPTTTQTRATLEVVAPGTAIEGRHADVFARYRSAAAPVGFGVFGLRFSIDAASSSGLLLLLLVAMLGGGLLNFTPCVLPVIPIKIISLSKVAGNRARCLGLGASMSAGVVAFWIGLGGLISTVSGFTATNQLFQYPAFTIAVGSIIAAMAVGMCGLFSIRLPSFVYSVTPKQESHGGSFGLGVMTAVLSTPCTAPFMGAAAAWAASQPPLTTLATFAAIGLGMALPYFALAAFPALVKRVPRSGPASVLIKEVMGLLLLAAAAYFVGTGVSALLVSPPDPPSRLHWWPVMGLCAAAGAWLCWRALRIGRSPVTRSVFAALGLLAMVTSSLGAVALTGKGPIDWTYYTEERFQTALAQDKVVVLDFTAEWCLNCKALEHTVLHSDDVARLLNADDVVPMKVDITGYNPEGKQKLREVDSLTIPLLLVFDADGNQVFRSDAYTADNVIGAIAKARHQ